MVDAILMEKQTLHIYCRVSTASQEDNTSLQQQRDKGIKLAGILGFDYQIWDEGAASSSKDDLDNRPVLTKLLGEMSNGTIKHLYSEYQDRLSRSQTTWHAIRYALRENNALYYSQLDTNPVDLTNPMDELLFGIIGVISQFDNRIREQRLTSGKFQRVAEGKWQGGPAPFGYRLEDNMLVVDDKESYWVKKIYEEYLAGKSHRDIQDILRSNGVITRRGNTEFSIGAIEKILTNTHYTGTYHVTRKTTGETWANSCPTIISKQLRDDVKKQREKRSNRRVTPTNKKYFYLLKGLLHCSECGREFRGRQTPSQKQAIYFDPAHHERWRRSEIEECNGVKSLKMNEADQVVRDAVLDIVDKSHIFREQIKDIELQSDTFEINEKDLKSAERKRRELEKRITKYTESIGTLKADVIMGDNKAELIATIEKLELDRERLEQERDATIQLRNDVEKGKRWKDWYSTFKNKVDDLRSIEVGAELKQFLIQIVERIDVVRGKEGEVLFDIHFTLPFIEDGLVYKDINDKKKGYEIIPGKSNYLIEYPQKKRD